jgi:hypothetical protein
MSTKQDFIDSMNLLNKALNIADECQPVLAKFLMEQPKNLMDMDALDWMAVDENIKSIMKPVQEFLQQVLDTGFFKEVTEQKAVHTPSLII